MRKKMTGTILKWGNSFGLRINKSDLEDLGLGVGDKVDILSLKRSKNPLEELFGSGVNKKPITKDRIKELRREIESKW